MADVVKNGRTKGGRTRFTSSNVQRMMDKAAPGGKQPDLSSKEARSKIEKLSYAVGGGPISGFVLKGLTKLLGKNVLKSLQGMGKAKAKKVIKEVKTNPVNPKPVSKADDLASSASKASPKVKPTSSKGLDSLVEGPVVSKNAGLAGNATRKTPVVKAKKPPPREVAPSKRSKAGEAADKAKAAKTKTTAVPKPKGKFTDIPTIGAKPPPRTTAPKPAPKPKAKAAKTKTTTTSAPKSNVSPILPAALAASTVAASISAGRSPKTTQPTKSTEPTKINKEPTKEPTKPEYESTMDKSAGKKPKPSANLSDAFKANTEEGFNPLSPESMAKNKSEKSPKSKKKKDPNYKLYPGKTAKKYNLKYMTDAGYEAEEDKISEYKSGGKIKKLKHGGKVMKKSKSGFMGKGAGCARTGY